MLTHIELPFDSLFLTNSSQFKFKYSSQSSTLRIYRRKLIHNVDFNCQLPSVLVVSSHSYQHTEFKLIWAEFKLSISGNVLCSIQNIYIYLHMYIYIHRILAYFLFICRIYIEFLFIETIFLFKYRIYIENNVVVTPDENWMFLMVRNHIN